jgi:hypothetical protein
MLLAQVLMLLAQGFERSHLGEETGANQEAQRVTTNPNCLYFRNAGSCFIAASSCFIAGGSCFIAGGSCFIAGGSHASDAGKEGRADLTRTWAALQKTVQRLRQVADDESKPLLLRYHYLWDRYR